MYKEFGGCPSGGVVGITHIKEKQCIIVLNDAYRKREAGFQ